MKLSKGWVLGLAGLLLIPFSGLTIAEDKPEAPAAKKSTEKGKDESSKEKSEAADPFEVPAEATPKELMEFASGLLRKQIKVKSREELIEYYRKVIKATLTATERILDAKDVEESIVLDALNARFEMLNVKGQLGDEDAAKLELDLATKFAKDSRAAVASVAKNKLLMAKLKNLKEYSAAEQDELFDEAVLQVKGDGKLDQKSLRTAMMIGNLLEASGNTELAAKAYDRFSDLFGHSGNPQLERLGKKMAGMSNRLRLVGNPIEIEGNLVDGNPVDWASYKGKVVLVDFWATWCGPCIAELPNVKSNYHGYHSKGFEVVGISLDEDKEKLTEFIAKNRLKWANLFSEDSEATGWDHPLATKYGVMGIPFTLLVGKDGNVIRMNVRGEALREELEKLLGPPDEEAVKAAVAEEERLSKEEEEKAKEEDKEKAKDDE